MGHNERFLDAILPSPLIIGISNSGCLLLFAYYYYDNIKSCDRCGYNAMDHYSESFLDSPLEKVMELSTKEKKALSLLGIKTMRQFIDVNLNGVFRLRGYGKGTYRKLRAHKELLNKHAVRDYKRRLLELPLVELVELSTQGIRSLSLQGIRALSLLKIRTTKQFLERDLFDVLKLRGYGKATFGELKEFKDLMIKQFGLGVFLESSEIFFIDFSPFKDVAGLSEKKAYLLSTLGVETVEDFLEFDLSEVFSLKGFGGKTYNRLLELQSKLRFSRGLSGKKFLESLSGGYSKETIRLLPLFSGHEINLAPQDFHTAFHINTPVDQIGLNQSSVDKLKELNIISLYELITTPVSHLANVQGLRVSQVQSAVLVYLHDKNNPPKLELLCFASAEDFLDSVLIDLFTNDRHFHVFKSRYCHPNNPRTLQEIGDELGITRERVRQIEKEAFLKFVTKVNHPKMRAFCSLMENILLEAYHFLSIKSLSNLLSRAFGWKSRVSKKALQTLTLLCSTLVQVEGRYIHLRNFKCHYCEEMTSILSKTLNGRHECMVADVERDVLDIIDLKCVQCEGRPDKLGDDFFFYIISSDDQLKCKFEVLGEKILSISQHTLLFGSAAKAAEILLYRRSYPCKAEDLLSELNAIRKRKVRSLATLSNQLMSSSNVLLWDRGRVFIHKRHVSFDSAILNKIEKWVENLIERTRLPQFSLYGAYEKFQDECNEDGLVSEYSIHACLKERAHPKLTFLRTPYVGLYGVSGSKTPNREIIKDYLLSEGGIVSKESLKKFAFDDLGLKDFQFFSILQDIEDVLITQRGYLHVDNLPPGSNRFDDLIIRIEHEVKKNDSISAKRIFDKFRISCHELGLDGPKMLHSLIQYSAPASVSALRYPLIVAVNSNSESKNVTISQIIKDYIKKHSGPLSLDEIHQHFVKAQGFSYSRVQSIIYDNKIVRYLPSSLIHIDSLDWDSDKQTELISCAKEYYWTQFKANRLFARLDLFIDIYEDELPTLMNGLPWTRTLVSELLGAEREILIIGNKKNAYVVLEAESRIKSFDDLITLLLIKNFNGGANLDEFSEYLHKLGIIVKRLSLSMFENRDRFNIGEFDISIKD